MATRAASRQSSATPAATTPAGQVPRKRRGDYANTANAAKRPRHQGLIRDDVPKIVEMVLDAIDGRGADDGEEIPTLDEVETESVIQEQWNGQGNSTGM